jgi:hypothetical protein
LLDQHYPCIKVDVFPPKGQNFRHPQTGTHRNNRHRLVRLLEHSEQLLELFRSEKLRPPLAFASALDPHQLDWVIDESALPMCYRRIEARITGVLWETVLSLLPDDLAKTLQSFVRKPGPTTTQLRRQQREASLCLAPRFAEDRICE